MKWEDVSERASKGSKYLKKRVTGSVLVTTRPPFILTLSMQAGENPRFIFKLPMPTSDGELFALIDRKIKEIS